MSERQPADGSSDSEPGAEPDAETETETNSNADGDADELYVVYWVDEQGYGGSCEFVHASSLEAAREQSSYASGGVAHQRLLFEGSFQDFREYVETELEDADRFELVWD